MEQKSSNTCLYLKIRVGQKRPRQINPVWTLISSPIAPPGCLLAMNVGHPRSWHSTARCINEIGSKMCFKKSDMHQTCLITSYPAAFAHKEESQISLQPYTRCIEPLFSVMMLLTHDIVFRSRHDAEDGRPQKQERGWRHGRGCCHRGGIRTNSSRTKRHRYQIGYIPTWRLRKPSKLATMAKMVYRHRNRRRRPHRELHRIRLLPR